MLKMLTLRPNPNQLTRCLLLLVSLSIMPLAAYAIAADRFEKVSLAADKASINQNTGTAIYTGNVRITQGSMQIRAARVEIKQGNNGSILAVVTGSPARFQQRLKAGEPLVTATANRIVYDSSSQTVKLRGNAELERAGDTIRSDEIDLDNGSGRLDAGGDERVQMIFEPPPPPQ